MEDVVQALMMAFAVMVFVIAFSVAMYMFSQVTTTAETLALYTDSTLYYDNVRLDEDASITDEDIRTGKTRIVNAETIIPTLYRYPDEEFCVKIYNSANKLIQIFDLDLEGKVQSAIGDTNAKATSSNKDQITNYEYKKAYNDSSKDYYLFGAPWLGNKENIKTRVDFFVNGKAGYIGNQYVDYEDNQFYQILNSAENIQFKERFISYSWSGETMMTEDGDTLVTGNSPKDKIVIIYTQIASTTP